MKKLSKKLKIWVAVAIILVATASAITSVVLYNGFGAKVKRASKNLSQYTIVAEYSKDNTITASQTLRYKNNTGEDLIDICFHLFPRAFREDANIKPYTTLNRASCFPNGMSYGDISISKVNAGEQSANFEFVGEDQDILRINLFEPLKENKEIELEIDFEVSLANCTHRLGYYNDTVNIGNWYPIVCAWENGAWSQTPYYSTGDPFVSEVANYTITLTHPEEYACFATGEEECSGNTCTFSALAVRDFAIVLSSKAKSITKQSGKTKVTYVGYEGDENIEACATLASKAVDYFSKTFGTYPYESLVVCKSAFLHGGMEYPNLVIVADNITEEEEFFKVIVHEIAHQWWYGVVGNNQISSAWMDESLSEYSTCLFFGAHAEYGINYDEQIKDATASYLLYIDVLSSLSGKVNTCMNCAVNQYVSEYEYTYMVYVKGLIMFDSLSDAVGEDKLLGAIKAYYKEYSFALASEQDFIDMLKRKTKTDLDGFFAGWLEGTNVITSTN